MYALLVAINWQSLLTGAAVGAIVAGIGAYANYRAGKSRDKDRRDHEIEMQKKRWDQEDRTRYQSERLAAYREMHNAAAFENLGLFYDPFSATYAYYPGQVAKGMDDISLRHSEILLLASSNEVRETANLIHSEAFVLRTKLMSRRYRADPSVNQKLSNWVRRKESPDGNWVRREASRLEGAAVEFVQAVRKEQGMEDW